MATPSVPSATDGPSCDVPVPSILTRFNLPLYYLCGLFFDFSVFFFWLVLPIIFDDAEVSPLLVGLANAVTFIIAGLFAPLTGYVADKWCAEVVVTIGCLVQAGTCFATAVVMLATPSIVPVFVLLCVQGVGLAMFWSPIAKLINDESFMGEQNKNLANFEMVSAFGKAVGFLFGGSATKLIGRSFSLILAGALALLVFLITPRFPVTRSALQNPSSSHTPQKPRHPRTFFITALVYDVFVYGVIAIICNQYVMVAEKAHVTLPGVSPHPSVFVGVFLCAVYIVQTCTFFLLGRWRAWQFRIRYYLLTLGALLLVCVALRFLRNGWVLLLVAIPFGFIAGYELQSTLFYSVSVSRHPGKFVGISELVGELTYSLSPVLAGYFTAIDTNYCHYVAIAMCSVGLLAVAAIALLSLLCRVVRRDKKTHRDDMVELEVVQHIPDSVVLSPDTTSLKLLPVPNALVSHVFKQTPLSRDSTNITIPTSDSSSSDSL